ncbi:2-oxoglutarate dehydrogenase E1 [Citrobacter koseri]|nr:2-oxoglutarate dehydrogenase E1 [Citrobacter koseri]
MSKARGYEVGGTVRIVINNQVGFTPPTRWMRVPPHTAPTSARWFRRRFSTLTRMTRKRWLSLPRLALDFRNTFKRDVFIDLVCYRRPRP